MDHTTPFAERWGGWYVTGTHGAMTHRGNQFAPDQGADQGPGAGQNVVELAGRFKLKPYLTPHSDIVALMVLEHQTGVHNRLARATLEGRIALHNEDAGTERVIRELGDELADLPALPRRGEADRRGRGDELRSGPSSSGGARSTTRGGRSGSST